MTPYYQADAITSVQRTTVPSIGNMAGWTCRVCGDFVPLGREPEHDHEEGGKSLTGVPICGVVSLSGPHLEPLGCGFQQGHSEPHAWASLPTWVEAVALLNDVADFIEHNGHDEDECEGCVLASRVFRILETLE